MGRALLRGGATALVALVVGPAATAVAGPVVTVEKPSGGSIVNSATPSFSGVAEVGGSEVTLKIYSGAQAEGSAVQTLTASVAALGGAWEAAATHLDDGTYTARASQSNLLLSETGESAPVTFTVDTASPTVMLNRPESPSKDTTPSFTGSASETTTPVVVHVYNSLEVEVSSATASGTGGAWASADVSPPLPSGEYTARATQASSIGNPEGKSELVAFTVDTAPPVVTLTPFSSLTNNTEPTFSGSAGVASGDIASVTLKVYSGASASGSPIRTATATPVGTTWNATPAAPLTDGTYTAVAEQSDKAGNVGESAPSTFTVKTKGPAVSLGSVASPTNDPTPSFSGGAGVAPGDIASVTLEVYSGDSASGSPVRTVKVTPTVAAWSTSLAEGERLGDGTYTAQAEQSDEAGNTTKSAPSTFTVDTTPPGLTMTPVGALTTNSKPTFSGTAGDASGDITLVTLKLYAGQSPSGNPVRTVAVSPSAATWSTTLEALNDGTYTAQAEQSDEAGNTTKSAPSTFTVDTTPPALTLTPMAHVTNIPTPSFSGAAGVAPGDIAAVTLKIYPGESASGTPVRTVLATLSGATWKASLAEALGDGSYTVQAEQSDEAGNTTKSAKSVFIVDTRPPAVSLTSVPTPTNETKPTFGGNAGVGSGDIATVTLKIYSGGSTSGSLVRMVAVTPGGATWKASIAEALTEGTYTAQAEQSDEAGNTGKSAASTFTVYTTPPALSLSPVTSLTKNPKPTFSGNAGDAAIDIPTVTLNIYAGAGASGKPIRTVAVTSTGATWKTTLAEALGDGTYTAQAEQSDEAGNTARSAPSTFTIDTTPPAVTLTPVASLTNNSKPGFSGGAGVAPGDVATVTLKIYSGGSASGSPIRTVPVASGGTAWTAGLAEALGDGTYTAQAEQSDEAGNTGKSSSSTFTVDTTPPAVSLSSVASFTNNPTPSFTGGAGVAPGDISPLTLKIYPGMSTSGSPVRTLTITPGGATWKATLVEGLPEGAYTAQAEQSDTAGNVGKSATSTFTIKTKGPVVSLAPVAATTNDSTPSFSGGAGNAPGDIATVTLNIYTGKGVSGSPVRTVKVTPSGAAWQVSVAEALSEGTYTAEAEQSDEAGNTTKSAQSLFRVDTTAPKVTITTPPKEVSKSRPTFGGGAGTAEGDLPTVTLKIFAGPSAAGTPAQTLLVTAKGTTWTTGSSGPQLPDGIYTAQAEQSDLAGNTGTSHTTFTIKTESPRVTLDTSELSEFARRGASLLTGATPSFTGTASAAPEDNTVTVSVYAGTSASGSPLQTVGGTLSGATWTAGPVTALAEGTYTVQAEQTDKSLNAPGVSAPVTFSVDTTAPPVTLTYPPNGSSTGGESELVRGVAGTGEGDLPGVTVQLFSGPTTEGQAFVQSIVVHASSGAWSTTFGGLSPGTYTARAEQSDDVGNVGVSAPSTFVVAGAGQAASARTPTSPLASFTWFPAFPHTREPISLASSSTDASSPITSFAWDLTGAGTFAAGGQVMSTSFSTPGNHVVRLRVTDANGLSSVATETIPVATPGLTLMQPFPVVRISSTDTASGIRLSVLRVQAPAGARIAVECKGRGCPARSESRVAAAGKVGAPAVEFRRFERSLRAGVILQIKVFKAGEIGKFTSFVVRRRRLPLRVDTCLGPTGIKPVACP